MTLKQKPWSKRGLLSIISSVSYPLGFATPFLPQGKLIIQQLFKEILVWDEIIPGKWTETVDNMGETTEGAISTAGLKFQHFLSWQTKC